MTHRGYKKFAGVALGCSSGTEEDSRSGAVWPASSSGFESSRAGGTSLAGACCSSDSSGINTQQSGGMLLFYRNGDRLRRPDAVNARHGSRNW